MNFHLHNDDLVVRTPFDDRYDLVQVMHGMRMDACNEYNHPVDFRCAGLVDKTDRDIWHIDILLSWATDEATPAIVYGKNIGANHAFPCAVVVQPTEALVEVRDIGTRFSDEEGVGFTLLKVKENGDLWFLSDNLGPDKVHFAFKDHIDGALTRPDDGLKLFIAGQRGNEDLHRSNQYIRKTVKDYGSYLEIDELYTVINPATVAEAVAKNRPEGGYTYQPDVAVGEALGTYHHVFTFMEDGTVKIFFDKKAAPGFMFDQVLGNMFQEKCNLGQGVVRYLNNVRPVTVNGVVFDFGKGVNINKQLIPERMEFTPDTWLDPENPPCEQRDVILDPSGKPFVTFSFRYELTGQGAPSVRKQLSSAWTFPTTRKTYPAYAENSDHITGTCYRSYTKANGNANGNAKANGIA